MKFPGISSIVGDVKGTTILLAFLSFSFYYFSYSFPHRTKRKETTLSADHRQGIFMPKFMPGITCT